MRSSKKGAEAGSTGGPSAASTQGFEQARHEALARRNGRDEAVFLERMRPIAVDAEAVEGRDAVRRREVAVRAAADPGRGHEVEPDLGRQPLGVVEKLPGPIRA